MTTKGQQTPKDREHYTSIAPDEDTHVAVMCFCRLTRDEDGRVRLYQCPTHAAAPEMLALLRDWTNAAYMPDVDSPFELDWFDNARALLAKIEGR